MMQSNNNKRLTGINAGDIIVLRDGDGDTWDLAWADDDYLYTPSNDTSGFGGQPRRNVAFNKLSGDAPNTLNGITVNNMDEYGEHGDKLDDNCTWKTSGCYCVDGVLYLAIGRHCYGHESGDPHKRQTVKNTSIIKSEDYGVTWIRSAQENYKNPHFTNEFVTPYFIYYGKNAQAPDVDNAKKYIYAVSNNGFWDSGDFYILGRVKREKLGDLNPSDWQYYLGGDGLQDSSWGAIAADAMHIIDNPRKCGETGATYIPDIGRYVLVGWYYTGNGRDNTEETWFTYYEAPHPWGPWTAVCEEKNNPEGWYCPRILSKWQQSDSEAVKTVMVTAGDWQNQDYYRMSLKNIEILA